jgi:Uma2 family endonuclease
METHITAGRLAGGIGLILRRGHHAALRKRLPRCCRKLMIMATQTALTLDQFLALPDTEDGTHYELSEGALITLPPPGYRHGVIEANIAGILHGTLDRKKYIIAGGDAGFILNEDPHSATVRGADVAVNKRETIGTIPETGYLAQAPLVAVEVVSPGNSATDLERKVSQYLSAGSMEVWLLYPDTQRLHVYLQGTREIKIYQAGESFTSVLGCEFPVAPFFEI